MANYGGYNQQSGYGQGNRYDQQAGGNPYAQQQQGGGNPYAQQPQQGNPYSQDVSNNPYAPTPPTGGYGRQASGYTSAQQGQNAYGKGNDMELGTIQHSTNNARSDPRWILNECSDIDSGITSINRNLEQLQYLQQQSLDDPDASQNTRTNRELDNLSAETMTLYRNFAARIKKLKESPESGEPQNKNQVGLVDRRLKDLIQKYQQVDAEFRKKLAAQMARQYRIVRPDASEAEVREAVEDTSSTQVFSQALLQSDRRGQSQSALRAVQGRHEAIQKIERQVIELAQLFEDMNALVVQQEPTVMAIDQHAENVQQDVTNANVQLDQGIKSARARNRKKWWCLGIGILIIILIAAAIALGVTLTKH